MLSRYWNTKAFVVASFFGLLLTNLLFTVPAYAQDLSNLSPQTILTNISQNAIPNLMRLVTAIAYVLGMMLIIRGVMELKHAGEMRTQMSHERHLSGPLIKIAIGALLLYLPTSVNIGMSTFWTSPNPYGYAESKDQWSQFIGVCMLVVQFVGTVAFIRGLLILSHAGGGHGQQGSFSRGLTHIIGGIFCINIYQFVQVIMATVGINS